LTGVLVALVTHAVTSLTWTESLLVGALLSPTDPVLSSSVVTNPRVPRVIRHTLNLESGLNDGLALPAVLAFAAALDPHETGFVWWRFVLQDVGIGLGVGLALGAAASYLMPRGAPLGYEISPHEKALFAIGVAFGTYGVAALIPDGNGFIAVFVAAIVFGVRRPEIRAHFEQRADELVEIVKLGIFLVFGSLLTLHALASNGWAALALELTFAPLALFRRLHVQDMEIIGGAQFLQQHPRTRRPGLRRIIKRDAVLAGHRQSPSEPAALNSAGNGPCMPDHT